MTGPTGTSSPVLVAVDDDPDLLRDVERELLTRYTADYRICCLSSAGDALATLDRLAAVGDEVALVLAGEELAGRPGTALLAEVPRTFPHAERALLVGWGRVGDSATGDAIFEAISRGRMDHYVVRPGEPPDEYFHQAVTSFLLRWAEAAHRAPYAVHVVGESWSGQAYELRETLERCALPHRFLLADSAEGRALVGGERLRFPL